MESWRHPTPFSYDPTGTKLDGTITRWALYAICIIYKWSTREARLWEHPSAHYESAHVSQARPCRLINMHTTHVIPRMEDWTRIRVKNKLCVYTSRSSDLICLKAPPVETCWRWCATEHVVDCLSYLYFSIKGLYYPVYSHLDSHFS